MFPTLSSLLAYFFGINIPLPVPTFGFFVALAFILSYCTFLSEFKRKERTGVIKPFKGEVRIGGSANLTDYLEYGFLGFLIGLKVIGAIVGYELFIMSPLKFIFSLQGSWWAAIFTSIIFAYLIYWQKKNNKLNTAVIKTVNVHPYQLMPKLILWAAVWGFLGAKIFNYLENIQMYSSYSFSDFWKYSGLTFLGGLAFGALSFLYIGHKRGMRLIDLADIGSPGMLVAYGIGRIGCQLSGDGDWGIVNNGPKPFSGLPDWAWSFKFPHNVLNQGEFIAGCTSNYCAILPHGVYPTSLYEAILILACFSILWVNRNKIKSPGLMFCFYLLIMGIERFFIEEIRINFKYDILGWSLSEAQMISILFVLLAGLIAIAILRKKRKLEQAVG